MWYSSHRNCVETPNYDGKIYILKRNHGDVVKIGETSKTATGRLKDYSKRHGLVGFRVHKVYKVPMEARKEIERLTFKRLKKYQIQDLAGAKEVFDCGVFRAEQAIESAIKESKIAIYARKKADAQAKYDKALEKRKQAAKEEFQNSNWLKTKTRHFENFVNNTVFEKKGERKTNEVIDDCFVAICCLACSATLLWVFASTQHYLVIIFAILVGFAGFNCLTETFQNPSPIPDQEALDKKKQMEDEIATAENNAVQEAVTEFQKKYKLEDFFEAEPSYRSTVKQNAIIPAQHNGYFRLKG